MAHREGQQHPIKLYLVVWGWLFVLSTCSFLVDYLGCEGFLRWFLILLFMIVKAGLIVAVFMHMAWERLALMYAILAPPGAVLLFVAIMVVESDYTHFTRVHSSEWGALVLRPRPLGSKPQGLSTRARIVTSPGARALFGNVTEPPRPLGAPQLMAKKIARPI
jgi:cytochrome c oxidase subunit IV